MTNTQVQYQDWVESKILFSKDLDLSIKTIGLSYFHPLKIALLPQISTKLRLGKMVERFFSFALKSNPRFKLIAENFQIIKDGITLGEIDFLIEDIENKEKIHLELVHKFYLYRPQGEKIETKNFVGPNLNDSLDKKLTKLKEKQFPILKDPFCVKVLKEKGIDPFQLKQKLLFTGSVYLKYKEIRPLELVNENCISGYWIGFSEFKSVHEEGDQYKIPKKADWLSNPQDFTDWMEIKLFWLELQTEITNKYSPMVWKKTNGKLEKLFVVWWD